MIVYNQEAFKELRHLLSEQGCLKKETNKEFMRYIGTLDESLQASVQTFYEWKKFATISCQKLMLLCNTVHFPVAYFFAWQPDGPDEPEPPRRHYRLIPAPEWISIRARLDLMITDMHTICGLNRAAIHKQFSISPEQQTIFSRNQAVGLSSLTLSKLVSIFQEERLQPSLYLIDRNEPLPIYTMRHHGTVEDSIAYSSYDVLRNENNTLQSTIQQLGEELLDLRQQLATQKSLAAEALQQVQNANSREIVSRDKTISDLKSENAQLKRQIKEQHKYQKRQK